MEGKEFILCGESESLGELRARGLKSQLDLSSSSIVHLLLNLPFSSFGGSTML